MVPGDKLKESKRGKKRKPKKVVELVAAEGGGAPSHWDRLGTTQDTAQCCPTWGMRLGHLPSPTPLVEGHPWV